jgi:hypothetical protein
VCPAWSPCPARQLVRHRGLPLCAALSGRRPSSRSQSTQSNLTVPLPAAAPTGRDGQPRRRPLPGVGPRLRRVRAARGYLLGRRRPRKSGQVPYRDKRTNIGRDAPRHRLAWYGRGAGKPSPASIRPFASRIAACNAGGARGSAPVRSEPIEVCTLHSLRLGSASSQHGADFVQRERPVRIVRVHERHVQTIGVPRIWRQLFWAASSSHGTSLAER